MFRLWLSSHLVTSSPYRVRMSSWALPQASLTPQLSPRTTLMSIPVQDLCPQTHSLLDYPHSGSYGSRYLMTRNRIDCNWAAKLGSQMRKKLGLNRGELASHRSVVVYSFSLGIYDNITIP